MTDVSITEATRNDYRFMREMLFEAVYWRSILRGEAPGIEEGLSQPGVSIALDAWGERPGDTGLIAWIGESRVGATWFRFYRRESSIRGYLDDTTPVVVLATSREHRRRGVGTALCRGLIDEGARLGIKRMSLMVSNDNHARAIYTGSGFRVLADEAGSSLMVREL